MKLFFSEYKSDYKNYIFPYAIWAIPEAHEKSSDIFAKGFLPNSPNLDRFYMCRHVRVALNDFKPSSENRRILRKGGKFSYKLIPATDLDFDEKWMEFCLSYAEKKFGGKVMTRERLANLVTSSLVSHFMVFSSSISHKNAGIVFLYVEEPALAFYYFSFYDLEYLNDSLGMFMMTATVRYFSEHFYDYIYLGSCYSRNALYKTQFDGAEFFNGFTWSRNMKELKYLIERDNLPVDKHLLENSQFIDLFYPQGVIDHNLFITK